MNFHLIKKRFKKENLDYSLFKGYSKRVGKKILFKGGAGNDEISVNRLQRKQNFYEIFTRKFQIKSIIKWYNSLLVNKFKEPKPPSNTYHKIQSNFLITIDPSINAYSEKKQYTHALVKTNSSTNISYNNGTQKLPSLFKNKSVKKFDKQKSENKLVDIFLVPPKTNEVAKKEILFKKLKKEYNFYEEKKNCPENENNDKTKKMLMKDVSVDLPKKKFSQNAIKLMKRKEYENNKIDSLNKNSFVDNYFLFN